MPRRSAHLLQRWAVSPAIAVLTLILTRAQAWSQDQVPTNAPYLNLSLPVEQRVNDLVSRMTLAEKVSQLRDHAAAIPRLNVPDYGWWNEAAHGVMGAGYATVFPQVIALGATWNTPLINRSERAGDEVVEVYLAQPKQARTPIRTLAGFTRVHLAPGETRHVTLTFDPRTIGQVNEQGERVIVPGSYQIFVGGTQPGESEGGVTGTFSVSGPAMILAL